MQLHWGRLPCHWVKRLLSPSLHQTRPTYKATNDLLKTCWTPAAVSHAPSRQRQSHHKDTKEQHLLLPIYYYSDRSSAFEIRDVSLPRRVFWHLLGHSSHSRTQWGWLQPVEACWPPPMNYIKKMWKSVRLSWTFDSARPKSREPPS